MRLTILCSVFVLLLTSVLSQHDGKGKSQMPVAVAPLNFAHNRGALNYAPALTVSRQKHCPKGYTLIGKQCESVQVSPAALVCPPGTTSSGGLCLTYTHASHVCPSGTQQMGTVCVSTQISSASYECHVGHLDHDTKMCELVTEVPSVCPPGYLHDPSAECSRLSEPSLVCPPDYTLEAPESCVRIITSPANPTCEPDMSLDAAGQCTKAVPVPAYCPAGYDMSGKDCIQTLPMINAPCPPGYESTGDTCVRPLELVASQYCPRDFILSAGICVQEIMVPSTCPEGAVPSPGGACEKYLEPASVCPEGTHPFHESVRGHGETVCKQTIISEPDAVCPSGFVLTHGKCKLVVVHPSAARCSQGTLQGGTCVEKSATIPAFKCPADFQMVQGPKCAKETSFDCSATVTTQQCEVPSEVTSLVRSKGHLPASGLNAVIVNKGVAVTQGKEPVCQDVTKVIPKTCNKSELVPAEVVCPEGSHLSEGSCTSLLTTPAEIYCPRGLLDQGTGQCLEVTIQSVEKVCSGDSRMEGKSCVKHLIHNAARVCPEGSVTDQEGRCVIKIQEIHHAPKIEKQGVILSCERGHLVDGKCLDSETVAKEFMCPPGAHDAGGKCIMTAPMVMPAPMIVTKPAVYVCADGHPATFKSCHTSSTVFADRVCHEGGSLHGEKCIHYAPLIRSPPQVSHTPAIPSCPPGQSLEGTHCISKTQEPAALVCPAGFELQDGGKGHKCAATHAMAEVCPPGTHRSDKGCVSRSVVLPEVTVIRKCSKGSC